MKYLIFATILFFFLLQVSAQNLVPNSSFELFTNKENIPEINYHLNQEGYTKLMLDWYSPTLPSTDILSYNTFWPDIIAPPKNGKYCTGMLVSYKYCKDLKRTYNKSELAQIVLDKPLIKGLKYKVQFDISGTNLPLSVSQRIGVLFTNRPWKSSNQCFLLEEYIPQVRVNRPVYHNWQQIHSTFVPDSNYTTITIGFYPENKKYKNRIYFAIDNVTIEEASYQDEVVLEYGKKILLEGVNFLSNSYSLNSDSYIRLDSIATIINANLSTIFKITGHTDNLGNEFINLELSKKRAEAVKKYLVEKGVMGYQLITEGKGKYEPIADNSSAYGRRINRRVELSVENILDTKQLYNRVLSSVKNGKINEAFKYINIISKLDRIPIEILVDEDLELLQQNADYFSNNVWSKIFEEEQEFESHSNPQLALKLRLISLKMKRKKIGEVEFWRNLKTIDAENLSPLEYEKRIYLQLDSLFPSRMMLPKKDEIGKKGMEAMLDIVYFSEDNDFYKIWAKRFSENSTLDSIYATLNAYIVDKTLMDSGKPQIYGTQWKDGILYMIKDTSNVNILRESVGLYPINTN